MNKIKTKSFKNKATSKIVVYNEINEKTKTFDLNWNCTSDKILWGKSLFLLGNNIVGELSKGIITVRSIEVANIDLRFICAICEYWEANHSNKSLWNWEKSEIDTMLKCFIVKPAINNNPRELYASTTVAALFCLIRHCNKLYLDGMLSEGFSHPYNASAKKKLLTNLLIGTGFSYADWLEGNSFGSVEPVIASIILVRTLDIIESEETRLAICLFEHWKKYPQSPQVLFRKTSVRKLDIIERYHAKLEKADYRAKAFYTELNSKGLGHITKLPWVNFSAFSAHCRNTGIACVITVMILVGHRISELISLKSSDWEMRDGNLYLKESIKKTLEGIQVTQVFPGMAAKAIETMWKLTFFDAEANSIPFFHRCYSTIAAGIALKKNKITDWIDKYGSLDDATLRIWLKKFFDNQILSQYPEIVEIHPKIVPHQFRHSWAEFALRRFDHNVEARIREHFIQKSDSATRRYTNRKLHATVRDIIEHEYLSELTHRFFDEPSNDRFMGPAYLKIKKEIDSIKILHPDEIEIYIQKFVDKLHRLAVFEWGYCVLMKDGMHEAKCYDHFSGLPNIDGGGSPELCTKCPNSMNSEMQANFLTRIAINHSHIAAHHPITAIGKLSEDIARQISKRLEKKNGF